MQSAWWWCGIYTWVINYSDKRGVMHEVYWLSLLTALPQFDSDLVLTCLSLSLSLILILSLCVLKNVTPTAESRAS